MYIRLILILLGLMLHRQHSENSSIKSRAYQSWCHITANLPHSSPLHISALVTRLSANLVSRYRVVISSLQSRTYW